MKKYLKKHFTEMLLIVLFGFTVIVSFVFNWQWGKESASGFVSSFLEMISFMPAIFILIGLVDAWVPKEVVQKHTGESAGISAVLWMILLAMLQAGPLYGAFPVAYLMWKKGTSVRNIFIYLGAFSTMKIPMLGFEIAFLGLKFTLVRTLFSIPVFLVIALIMDKLFAKNFVMQKADDLKKPNL